MSGEIGRIVKSASLYVQEQMADDPSVVDAGCALYELRQALVDLGCADLQRGSEPIRMSFTREEMTEAARQLAVEMGGSKAQPDEADIQRIGLFVHFVAHLWDCRGRILGSIQ